MVAMIMRVCAWSDSMVDILGGVGKEQPKFGMAS